MIEKLAALVPPPQFNLVRNHGVLAAASAWRSLIVPDSSDSPAILWLTPIVVRSSHPNPKSYGRAAGRAIIHGLSSCAGLGNRRFGMRPVQPAVLTCKCVRLHTLLARKFRKFGKIRSDQGAGGLDLQTS